MPKSRDTDLQDLVRRAFLVGYDCGREDERISQAETADLPDNVISLCAHRDQMLRQAE